MGENNMTRRAFVGTAGVAAGVAAGIAATGAAAVPMAKAEDCAYQTEFEGDVDPIAPVDAPEAWDYEADVVVVGAGGGLTGALRALDLGGTAIVLEKLPITGGETQEACVWAFTSGNQVQLDAGLPDVTETLRERFYGGAPFGAKQHPFIDNVMAGSNEVVKWTTDMGFAWEPGWSVGEEAVYAVAPAGSQGDVKMNARNFVLYTEWAVGQIEEKGGQILTSTEAQALVMADGAVVGVQATAEDGSTIYVKANKGVLLSTNGIAANRAMLAKYCPDALRTKYNSAGSLADGKGIRMGFGAGAGFSGYDQYGIFDGGLNKLPWESYLYNAATQLVRQPWLGIDVHGDRYAYLTTALSGFTGQGKLLKSLPGNQGYVIFDDDWYTNAIGFDQLMCRMPLCRDVFGDMIDRLPEYLQDFQASAQQYIDDGVIESADTIEELAGKLGLDVDVVVKAVDDYNAIVEAGEDPEGPYAEHPEYLKPIAKAPFHGAAIGGFCYATSAGLDTNEKMQVMDVQGNVIPGLYATGAAAGRDVQVCGSCCFANVSAYLAATNALA